MPTTGFVKLYMDTLWVHCLFFEIILRAFHKARYGGRLDLGACDHFNFMDLLFLIFITHKNLLILHIFKLINFTFYKFIKF